MRLQYEEINLMRQKESGEFYSEHDSSDDENDLFSSDQMHSSGFHYNKDSKFKSGEEDFQINTGF